MQQISVPPDLPIGAPGRTDQFPGVGSFQRRTHNYLNYAKSTHDLDGI